MLKLLQTAVLILQEMSSLKDKLVTTVSKADPVCTRKITIVGTGQVGMACAFNILINVCIN